MTNQQTLCFGLIKMDLPHLKHNSHNMIKATKLHEASDAPMAREDQEATCENQIKLRAIKFEKWRHYQATHAKRALSMPMFF